MLIAILLISAQLGQDMVNYARFFAKFGIVLDITRYILDHHIQMSILVKFLVKAFSYFNKVHSSWILENSVSDSDHPFLYKLYYPSFTLYHIITILSGGFVIFVVVF